MPTSCSSAWDRGSKRSSAARTSGACICGTGRPSRAVRAVSASPPASSSTRNAPSPSSRRSYAAGRSRAADHRNIDRAYARARGQGALSGEYGHPLSRSYARALRKARRVRSEGQGDRRPGRRPAPHSRGPRHRARRGGFRCGWQSARDQPRGLLRDADGRDARSGGDRSWRPATCSGRPQSESVEGRRSSDGTRPRLLRGLRDRRACERAPESAVRTLEPSSCRGRLQGVCTRVACRRREGQAPRAHVAQHEGAPVSRIALIDYKAGNLTSVRKAFAALGATLYTPERADELAEAHAIVVPGVGHFGATKALGPEWIDAILARIGEGRPLLGICLGMQLLFEGSEEAPELPGLGLLNGRCYRLPANGIKIPHVGWNALDFKRSGSIVEGVANDAQVYFTHSYVGPVTGDTVAVTTHGQPFASIVQRGQVAGVQFHPEKSGDVGLQVLRNFLSLAG